jgi:hypothetical protein
MTDYDVSGAEKDMWTTYLSHEWDGWFRASRLDPADMGKHTTSLLSSAFALWHGLFSAPLAPTEVDPPVADR